LRRDPHSSRHGFPEILDLFELLEILPGRGGPSRGLVKSSCKNWEICNRKRENPPTISEKSARAERLILGNHLLQCELKIQRKHPPSPPKNTKNKKILTV
jgi:hypothetical protein